MVVMRLKAMAHVVVLRSPPFSMWSIVLAVPGDIGGCGPSGLKRMWSEGGKATSCMDGVGEKGMYWTEGVEDDTEM